MQNQREFIAKVQCNGFGVWSRENTITEATETAVRVHALDYGRYIEDGEAVHMVIYDVTGFGDVDFLYDGSCKGDHEETGEYQDVPVFHEEMLSFAKPPQPDPVNDQWELEELLDKHGVTFEAGSMGRRDGVEYVIQVQPH